MRYFPWMAFYPERIHLHRYLGRTLYGTKKVNIIVSSWNTHFGVINIKLFYHSSGTICSHVVWSVVDTLFKYSIDILRYNVFMVFMSYDNFSFFNSLNVWPLMDHTGSLCLWQETSFIETVWKSCPFILHCLDLQVNAMEMPWIHLV